MSQPLVVPNRINGSTGSTNHSARVERCKGCGQELRLDADGDCIYCGRSHGL
jgi:hypothetical protein